MLTSPIDEPLAIVGMACRFPPDLSSPTALWDALCRGVDGIRDIPNDRWDLRRYYDPDPSKVGKMYVRQAGTVTQPFKMFDAQFFEMSPREAACVDPQQRLVLEVAYEAFEDAGQPLAGSRSSRTGVFVGGFMVDNMISSLTRSNRDLIGLHTGVGCTMTALSARIAYALDLRGPVLSIDTACSSSLIAAHYACQSLWRKECDSALVAGVNFLLMPAMTVALCKAGLLSPDARCKAFDGRANGYVRAEGAGAVLLKPLRRAVEDGNPIYALIRGTAANHGGHTEGGMSVPSVEAQAELIGNALAQAQVAPHQVQYVEAHGTGTAVGDVVETRALHEAFGRGRPAERPLVIGSVKTNFGHTEAAAGVAGLIKAALALHHRQIPGNLHFETPNPKIDFDTLKLRVAQGLLPWPEPGVDRRLAGVNSFGFGGTNAHVILEGYDAPPRAKSIPRANHHVPTILALSARSDGALRSLAARYAEEASTADLADLGFSAATRRTMHNRRLAIVVRSSAELQEALTAHASGGEHPLVQRGRAREGRPLRVAWVYTGMGPQWFGMGRELYGVEPAFRDIIERADRTIRRVAGWSLLHEMEVQEAGSRMTRTEVAQAANVALQAALTELLRSWGAEPGAVVGHSVGEIGAAYAAGVLGLDDAVELACHRGEVLAKASGKGGMLAVELGLDDAQRLLVGKEDLVSIAAVNGPTLLTLSGDSATLLALSETLTKRDIFNKALRVTVPYHSPVLDPLTGELTARLATLRPLSARLPLYSTVLGARVTGSELDARYWTRNLREPVAFAATIDALLEAEFDAFLEVGPHPVLADAIQQNARRKHREVMTIPTLHRNKPEGVTLKRAVASLFTIGQRLNWQRLFPADAAPVPLPTYPWDRALHWSESAEAEADRVGGPAHPILGERMNAPSPRWAAEVNELYLPYLSGHRVGGEVLMPGAAYLEAAVAMIQAVHGEGPVALEDVKISAALIVGTEPILLESSLDSTTGAFTLHSRVAGSTTWKMHASGCALKLPQGTPMAARLGEILARLTEDPYPLYPRLAERMYEYGPSFRQVRRVFSGADEALVEIVPPPELEETRASEYRMHPATLDACFHAALALLPRPSRTDTALYVPLGVRRLVMHRPLAGPLFSHARLTSRVPDRFVSDLRVFDSAGQLLLEIDGLYAQALAAQDSLREDLDRWTYRYAWRRIEAALPASVASAGRWVIVSDQVEGAAVSRDLERLGKKSLLLGHADRAAFARTLGELATCEPALEGVVIEAGPGLTPAASLDDTKTIMTMVRALKGAPLGKPPRLWILTRGAESVSPSETVSAVGGGVIWGAGRTLMSEQQPLRVTLVDVAPGTHAARVAELLVSDVDDEELALRDGGIWVHRMDQESFTSLERSAAGRSDGALPELIGPRFGPQGTYVLTGGLGGLGLFIASWLVDHGARHVLLLGRRPPSAPAIAAIAALRRRGAAVESAQVDVTSMERLRAVFDSPPGGLPPVRGVVHAAVEFSFGIDTTPEQLEEQTAAKVIGAWNLHELTMGRNVDLFLLLSSVAANVGTTGGLAYAAANAFLDSLVMWRRGRGLAGCCIALGAIDDVGALVERPEYRRSLADTGFPASGVGRVFACVGYALERRFERLGVWEIDWAKVEAHNFGVGRSRRFREVIDRRRRTDTAAVTSTLDARHKLTSGPVAELPQRLVAGLKEIVGPIIGTPADRLDPEVPLGKLGVDSLMSAQLRSALERTLGLTVNLMSIIRGPTLSQLARQLVPQLTQPSASSEAPAGTPGHQTEDNLPVDAEALRAALADVDKMSEPEVVAALRKGA